MVEGRGCIEILGLKSQPYLSTVLIETIFDI